MEQTAILFCMQNVVQLCKDPNISTTDMMDNETNICTSLKYYFYFRFLLTDKYEVDVA